MNFRLKIFLIIVLLLAIMIIFRALDSKRISIRYGMYLTFIIILLFLCIVFPNLLKIVANYCGFKEVTSLLFFVSISIIFYVIFRLYMTITKLNEINKNLIQEISILKKENNLK